jgi:bacteriorhodopsin
VGTQTPTPELQTMPPALYDLVTYSIVGAGFALVAYLLYSWHTTGEVSARYRPAVVASLALVGVAALSYLLLYTSWKSGFELRGGVYEPTADARETLYTRYIDWSVTVPLLTVELLAVCSLTGARARNLRFSTMAAAFLMILTGFLGSQVVGEGRDRGALVLWGVISTVFYLYLNVALIGAVRASLASMGSEAAASLRNATIVLLGTFGVYPLVYAIPVFVDVTPAWFTTMQVAYSAADVLAKVGFGVLVHKVAKLRTAEDVAAGADTHPEPVWVSNAPRSVGVLPELSRISPAGLDDLRSRRHEHDHAASSLPVRG